jgi:hypothetical protein
LEGQRLELMMEKYTKKNGEAGSQVRKRKIAVREAR